MKSIRSLFMARNVVPPLSMRSLPSHGVDLRVQRDQPFSDDPHVVVRALGDDVEMPFMSALASSILAANEDSRVSKRDSRVSKRDSRVSKRDSRVSKRESRLSK